MGRQDALEERSEEDKKILIAIQGYAGASDTAVQALVRNALPFYHNNDRVSWCSLTHHTHMGAGGTAAVLADEVRGVLGSVRWTCPRWRWG